MSIDGKIESAQELTSENKQHYWLATTKGRRFVTHDFELGRKLVENEGSYGRFTYKLFASANPNTYYLLEWEKV